MDTLDYYEKQKEYIERMRSLSQKYFWQWRAHAFAHNAVFDQ
ncbi:MAG TPA: hypothetical protein VEP90_19330 [Methylomirabilota bacterium]|nr:hypothetical protein [Methylomirabilota bacterium]